MHLMLHIFKKDVRRLWWGIAIALLLEIAVAYAGEGPDSLELSVLLLVTWACLIALAVHDDPLVGDRQFWITRPSRWRVLLGSKLLFAVAVVHIPYFVASVAVLAARGFHPWEWLPSLLTKQILIAMALTLPMIALAAVLRNFAYLALAAISIGGLTAFASGFQRGLYSRWRGVDDTRWAMFFAFLAVAGAVIVVWQFARRRTWPSRLIGMAAVLAAELVLGFTSPIFIARVRAAFYPTHTSIAFHLAPQPALSISDRIPGYSGRTFSATDAWIAVRLPLRISGIPDGLGSLYDLPLLEIVAGANSYQFRPEYIGPDWMILPIRREVYESLRDVKVELKGAVPTILFRVGQATSMPVGTARIVPGAGRCSSSVVDRQGSSYNGFDTGAGNGVAHRFLEVVCESPDGFPLPAFFRLRRTSGEDAVRQFDWTSARPRLSPIERDEDIIVLGPGEDPQASGTLGITPAILKGWQVVNLGFRDIRLSDYVAQ